MSSKRYVFTINNFTNDDTAAIATAAEDKENIRYIVYGRETAPTTGTPHLQGFAIFTKKIRIPQAKRILGISSAHLEPARGTSEQAAQYCKKDGAFTEYGTCPKDKGEGEQQRWELARTAAREGRFDDIPADIYLRYLGNIKKIFAEAQSIPQSIDQMDFHWFWGPTGTGKSSTARRENPNYYLKGINKWWDGYDHQPCVIIEEWGPMDPGAERHMGHYLKQWCDHHPFQAETKGGMRMIRPPKIIITSNYRIEDCFHDENILDPLKRRLHIHHFSLPFSTCSPTQII